MPEATDIGCDLKITPVGGGGGRLHVSQALTNSVSLPEELNQITTTPPAPEKLLADNVQRLQTC